MAGKGRPKLPIEPWYEEVIWYMVRENVGFSFACQALGIKFASGKVEEGHQNRKSFRDLYWRINNSYLQQVGGDPTLTKEAAMGLQWKAANNLAEKGDFDKVATAIQVLAKMAGWLKEEQQTTVFASLNQNDIDAIRKKLTEKLAPQEEQCAFCSQLVQKSMMGRHLASRHPDAKPVS